MTEADFELIDWNAVAFAGFMCLNPGLWAINESRRSLDSVKQAALDSIAKAKEEHSLAEAGFKTYDNQTYVRVESCKLVEYTREDAVRRARLRSYE